MKTIEKFDTQMIDPALEAGFVNRSEGVPSSCLHVHNHYELTFVTKGTMTLYVGEEGESAATEAHENELLVLRPWEPHRKTMTPKGSYLNLSVRSSMVEELFSYLHQAEFLKKLLEKPSLSLPIRFSPVEFAAICETIQSIYLHAVQHPEQANFQLRLFLLELVGKKLPFPGISTAENAHPSWLADTLQLLEQPEMLRRGMEVFRELPYSEGYFCRKFKAELGMTPTQYITKARLQSAARQLLSTNEDILEICNNCGFSSLSYFYHIFQEHYHTTPANFRRKLTEETPFFPD